MYRIVQPHRINNQQGSSSAHMSQGQHWDIPLPRLKLRAKLLALAIAMEGEGWDWVGLVGLVSYGDAK